MHTKLDSDAPTHDHAPFHAQSAVQHGAWRSPQNLYLAGETDDWMPYVDNARAADRTARIARGEADAERVVANQRFDGACTGFGDDLYLAVNKDRASTRWLMFFSVPVNRFVRQALHERLGHGHQQAKSGGDEAGGGQAGPGRDGGCVDPGAGWAL